MTLGRQLRRPELPTVGARWCEAALPEGSVYRFLGRGARTVVPAGVVRGPVPGDWAPLGAAV
ncbi:MAG TPA: hypothetical protein VIJ05_10710, partial [Actinomycetes bacterium]